MTQISKVTEKDYSCYTSTYFSKYLIKKGLPTERLFEGIEQYQETLQNPLEWINGSIIIAFMQNVERELGNGPDVIFSAAVDWALKETKAFQLLFFRLVPLTVISKIIREHSYKTINKGTIIELDNKIDGEADVRFTPLPGTAFSKHVCDFNRGVTFALCSLRGYKNLKLTELSCAAREFEAKACHYKITWTPRPSLIRTITDFFFLRLRNHQTIITHMQENHEKLQAQYNETNRLYEKIVKSEARFRTIFENIQDVYFEIAQNGTFLEISPSINSISLYTRKDLLITRFQDICFDTNALSDILHELETRERISDYEIRIKNKNGSVIYCTITARLIKEDEQVKLTGVLRDSTERKRAEEEKQKLQEQLRQSEKLQALGQMAGGVAHDFKNQLFGIAANARLIKSKSDHDAFLVTCADNILKSAHRSSELTKQLLAFARRGTFQTVAIDLHETVKELIVLLERTLDKPINLTMQLNAQKPIINGDPSQIENALLNLALNSRDAMLGGGVLTFITENVTLDDVYCSKSEYGIKPGEYIKISVKDTGKGIEKEHLNNLFEPFFTTKEMGNGLGLSAVYGTVKEHNGAIEIETAVGTGTTVSVFLPLSLSRPIKKELPGQFLRAAINMNLLLVEDEEIVRNGAKEALQQVGFKVHAYGDGTTALNYYKENHGNIHLILLDMILPDLSVQDLFARIQEINPQAKIILWSAYTLPEIVNSLRAKGALDFIDKGSDIGVFVKRVSEIAKKK